MTAQGQASQLPAGQTGGTVLLVEDEEAIGAIVRTYLGRDGYRVVWVRTGEEALAEFTRHPIRIVVLDIGLPGVDGFEVCRRIRAQSAVPILMLTARDEAGPRRRSRARRRRLRAEAVLAARARRPCEGDPPPLRALAAREPHRAR